MTWTVRRAVDDDATPVTPAPAVRRPPGATASGRQVHRRNLKSGPRAADRTGAGCVQLAHRTRGTTVHNPELLMAEAYDEGVVSEVIRPAAIIPEESARAVLVELALRDVQNGGVWQSEPSLWSRYDRAVGGLRLPRRRRADRDHPGRLRHAHPLRDHDLPGHCHAVRHGTGLDRRGAVQRGARLRQPGPRQLPPGHR